MIKVFLHISVHIGTKLSELAFPGTERHTREGGGTRAWLPHGVGGRAGHIGRTSLLRQAWGRGQGRGGGLYNLESARQTSGILSTRFTFTDGKRGPERETGPNAPKQVIDEAAFPLSRKGSALPPERGLCHWGSLWGSEGTGETGARWMSLSWLLGVPVYSLCACSLCVCLPQSPSPHPQSPGRSSLLIKMRTAELQLCTRPAPGARLAARQQGWGGQQRAPPVLRPSPHGPSHQARE